MTIIAVWEAEKSKKTFLNINRLISEEVLSKDGRGNLIQGA